MGESEGGDGGWTVPQGANDENVRNDSLLATRFTRRVLRLKPHLSLGSGTLFLAAWKALDTGLLLDALLFRALKDTRGHAVGVLGVGLIVVGGEIAPG